MTFPAVSSQSFKTSGRGRLPPALESRGGGRAGREGSCQPAGVGQGPACLAFCAVTSDSMSPLSFVFLAS